MSTPNTPPRKKSASPSETKDRLLKESARLFASHGFNGVSVKDIAEAAGVNISLISYHFGGKEGLYRACLEPFGKMGLATVERILQPAQTAEEFSVRLKMYFEEVLHIQFTHPEITTIIQRDASQDIALTQEIFRETFLELFQKIIAFFTDAQKINILRSDVDPLVAAGISFGGLLHSVRMDAINKKVFGVSLSDPAHRSKVIEQTIRLVLEGMLSKRAHPHSEEKSK